MLSNPLSFGPELSSIVQDCVFFSFSEISLCDHFLCEFFSDNVRSPPSSSIMSCSAWAGQAAERFCSWDSVSGHRVVPPHSAATPAGPTESDHGAGGILSGHVWSSLANQQLHLRALFHPGR